MFTGIITDIGTVIEVKENGGHYLKIATNYDTSLIELGASICCSGVCLTVTEKGEGWFAVVVSEETLACSTAFLWQAGNKINLEKSLKMGDEMGGHIVTGHVDGLSTIVEMEAARESWRIKLLAPEALKLFIAKKGSVSLNGVSLTVNEVEDDLFTINIIPHSWENTTFHELQVGSQLNLEIDVIARYIARRMEKTHEI